jgi:hypothetical protein
MQIAEIQAQVNTPGVCCDLDVYEAPKVELVLSAADFDREVFYAGVIISCNGADCPPPQ